MRKDSPRLRRFFFFLVAFPIKEKIRKTTTRPRAKATRSLMRNQKFLIRRMRNTIAIMAAINL